MFHNFECNSADDAWSQIAKKFSSNEVNWTSVDGREGATKELLHATISISDPRQRLIQNRPKALNIALALAETIWILCGRQDSAFLRAFFPKIKDFSGDTENFHGAYGQRLRNHFTLGDQLHRAYLILKSSPENRQVVLSIWDPNIDLPNPDGSAKSRDIPCNVTSLLKVREGKLEWLQLMRSNDVFRGLPNNIVQFTTIQEVMAGWLGVELGSYNHISDSLHVYDKCLNEIYNLDRGNEIETNTDSLLLPYDESKRIFGIISNVTDSMISGKIKPTEAYENAIKHVIPEAFSNILSVLCSEILRRNGSLVAAQDMINQCTNPLFSKMWNRWMFREHPKWANSNLQ